MNALATSVDPISFRDGLARREVGTERDPVLATQTVLAIKCVHKHSPPRP